MKKNKNWKNENSRFDTGLTKVLLSGLFLFLLTGLSSFPASAEDAAVPQTVVNKTASGEVGATMGRGFALIYKEDASSEFEMWFPFNDTVLFTGGYIDSDDLTTGDKVQVSYDETEDKMTRTLKSVSLIKKGEPPVIIEETEETEEPAAETNE